MIIGPVPKHKSEDTTILKIELLPHMIMCVQAGGEEVVVTQFHMTGWPEEGRPDSTASVLELLDMTTGAQMNSGRKPITVICK